MCLLASVKMNKSLANIKNYLTKNKYKIICEYKTLIKTGGKIIKLIYNVIADMIKIV